MSQQLLELYEALNNAATIISMQRQTTNNPEIEQHIEEAMTALSKAGMIILKEYAANK